MNNVNNLYYKSKNKIDNSLIFLLICIQITNDMNKRVFLVSIIAWFSSLGMTAQNSQYIAYISKYKDLAIEQMKLYRIPASITLAQGLFESAAGQSQLALRSNNHFGIKCGTGWTGKRTYHDDDAVGECFRTYNSVRDSYEDHSQFLRTKSRYADLFKLSPTDYKGWANGLKKAGYATNPAYAQRLISIIEQYSLYVYDTGKGGKYSRDEERKLAQFGLSTSEREVLLVNGLLVVLAREGDTTAKIAKEFDRKEKNIIRYNDFYPGYQLTPGERVYVERKKGKASMAYFRKSYIIKDGDSMHSIAQEFGIRLKSLYKMNKMHPDDAMPKVGTPIRIR